MLHPETFIYALDLTGCAAAAVAASTLAKRVGFDPIGAIMIAAVAAIGGGTCRDVLINRHPLFWLHNLTYLWLVSLVAILVFVFYHSVEKHVDKPLRLFDALGLSAFAVIGFEAALSKDLPYPIVILMGVMTSVFGGILRDIICGQLPLVLQKEIYILCVVIGGLVYLGLMQFGVSLWLRDVIAMLVVFVIRLLAIYRNWNLPNITLPPR